MASTPTAPRKPAVTWASATMRATPTIRRATPANVTGSASLSPELGTKRLELLKQAVPRLGRVALLLNPATISTAYARGVYEPAAKALTLELAMHEVRSPQEFAGAFAAIAKSGAGAVHVTSDTLFRTHAQELVSLAFRHKLPMTGGADFVDAGFLMGYGPSQTELYFRGAYFVDRILKGAKPADLPIERASKFELVVNLKTAKALGLRIPDLILARADRVIE